MTASQLLDLITEADRIASSPTPERRAVGLALVEVLGDFVANGRALEPEGDPPPTWHMKRPNPRCPDHGPMVESKGRWGQWQDCRWVPGQWRQLVCVDAGCWAYFIQRRSSQQRQPARVRRAA
jgi:hypothetical protein